MSEFANYNYSNTQKQSHSWKKSTKDLRSLFLAFDDGFTKTKNTKTNSSTLFLHISPYKKSFDGLCVGKVVKSREMQWNNVFEFPRQQENGNPPSPELSQFRASQRLQNPNQMDQTNNAQQMPQYPPPQQQHLAPPGFATFQYNQSHGVYPNPSFQDPLSDVLRRLAEMDARMNAYDQKIEELEQKNRLQGIKISELSALLINSRPLELMDLKEVLHLGWILFFQIVGD